MKAKPNPRRKAPMLRRNWLDGHHRWSTAWRQWQVAYLLFDSPEQVLAVVEMLRVLRQPKP